MFKDGSRLIWDHFYFDFSILKIIHKKIENYKKCEWRLIKAI